MHRLSPELPIEYQFVLVYDHANAEIEAAFCA